MEREAGTARGRVANRDDDHLRARAPVAGERAEAVARRSAEDRMNARVSQQTEGLLEPNRYKVLYGESRAAFRRASGFAGRRGRRAPLAPCEADPARDSSRSSPSSRGRGRASGAQGGGACATYVRGRGRESGSGSPTCGGMSLISLNWVSRMYPVVGRKGCSRQLLSPAVPEPDLPGGDIWPAWGQCTRWRFHGPNRVGIPRLPMLVNAARQGGSYFNLRAFRDNFRMAKINRSKSAWTQVSA